MRAVKSPSTRHELRARRHLRVRKKVAGTAGRPRLVVFRSLKHIYAQLVNDDQGVTLLGVSDASEGVDTTTAGKVNRAKATGKLLAEKAKAAGVTKVVFDRAGYRYHGRVQAVAEGAVFARRDPGLLHLAEDLRFAQDHRVQPGRDPEQVPRRVKARGMVEVDTFGKALAPGRSKSRNGTVPVERPRARDERRRRRRER